MSETTTETDHEVLDGLGERLRRPTLEVLLALGRIYQPTIDDLVSAPAT